ncbi:MAG: hypothetical protein LW832_07165 [Parachlamydia sp.]|jgi:hypothetical protein|nr:hypothetical protein [Parachlamydia sp.]
MKKMIGLFCVMMHSALCLTAAQNDLSPLEMARIEERRLDELPDEDKANLLWAGAQKVNFQDEQFLYRIHESAYQAPMAVTSSGDMIQLRDGSKWSVHPYQRETVRWWVQDDALFIKPKSSCFSSYHYVLQNRSTNEAVEVNLIEAPVPTGIYTRWIINIEPYKKQIELNDKTIWQINSDDAYLFSQFSIGQRVMIGVNNHWRIAKHPHVILNPYLHNTPYVEAEFLGYEEIYY